MEKVFYFLSFILFFALSFLPGRSFMMFEYNGAFKLVWITTIFFALIAYLRDIIKKKSCPATIFGRNVFLLLLLSTLLSTILSEFRDVAWFCVMPILSSLSLGYLCYKYLISEERLALINVARALGLLFFLIFVWSIILYIASDANGTLCLTAENILNNTILSPIRFLEIYAKKTRNHYPFWHSNYVAGFCVLSIPVIAGLIFTDKKWCKFLWILTFGLAIVVLYTAESRGGYLGFSVFLFLVSIVIFNIKNLPYKKFIFLAIISIFAAVLINDGFRNTLVDLVFKFNFADDRVSVWNAGIKIGLSNPISGNGIGTSYLLYGKFWNGNGIPEIYQLYSTPITIFADLGFVGIVLWSSLFFLGMYYWIKLLRSEGVVKKEKILTTAFIFSLISYAVMSWVDYQLSIYPISGSLAIITACVIASYDRNFKQYRKNDTCSCGKIRRHFICKTIPKALPIILIVCFAFMIWYQYKDFMARKNFKLAIDSFYNNKNLSEAEKKVNIALGWQPKNFGFLNHLSSMFVNASKLLGGKKGEFFKDKARVYLEKSITLHEYQEYPYDVLGWIYLDKDPQKAEFYFQKALYMSSTNKDNFWGLGLSCLKQNKKQKAMKAFALEFLINPNTVLSVNGYNTIKDYPEIIDELSKYYNSSTKTKKMKEDEIIRELLLKRLFFYWWCNGPFEKILTEINNYTDNISAKDSKYIVWLLALFKGHDGCFIHKDIPSHLLCYEAYLTAELDEREKIIMNVLRKSGTVYNSVIIEAIAEHLNKLNNNYLSLIKSSLSNKSIPLISCIRNYPCFNLAHNNFDGPPLCGTYEFRCNLLVFIALMPFIKMESETYFSGKELREIIKTL